MNSFKNKSKKNEVNQSSAHHCQLPNLFIQTKKGLTKKELDNFRVYNNTNRGIFYYDNYYNKKKKGGFLEKEFKCLKDSIYTKYCNKIKEYNENVEFLMKNPPFEWINDKQLQKVDHNIDNSYMRCLINSIYDGEERAIPSFFNQLHTSIDENLKEEIKNSFIQYKSSDKNPELKITHDKSEKYLICDLEVPGDKTKRFVKPEEVNIQFRHSGYNREIVTAFQKPYIDNIDNLQQFIQEQEAFIAKMPLKDKIIINDYTKYSCFHIYSTLNQTGHIDNVIQSGSWIHHYKINTDRNIYKLFHFGDSLYKQILDVIGPERFTHKIRNDPEYQSIMRNSTLIFTNITTYWEYIRENGKDRKMHNSASIFYEELSDQEWHEVLVIFADDINNIVKNACKCNTDIYCYRGVTNDYVLLEKFDSNILVVGTSGETKDIVVEKGKYLSTRIGSFSINFESSLNYSYENPENRTGDQGCLYSVTIRKGVHVLYIPSLSFASHEFEILHASLAEFDFSGDRKKCFNNYKNEYGILSVDSEGFTSADIVFTGYKEPLYTLQDNIKILRNIYTQFGGRGKM